MNSASSGCANRTSALAKVRSVMTLPAYRPPSVARTTQRPRAGPSGNGTAMGAHRHPAARPERDDRLELDPMRWVVLEPPRPTDRRQQDGRFELGEPLADAHPGTAAEGQERMAARGRLLVEPSFRQERPGVGPPTRVVMHQPGRDDHDGAGWDPDAVRDVFGQ